MARVEEKKPLTKAEAAEKRSNIAAIIIGIASIAVLIFIVVIIVLTATKKDSSTEEKKYDPTYTQENTDNKLKEISLTELNALVNPGLVSDLYKPVVYVFIYSPNYDAYDPDTNDDTKNAAGLDSKLQEDVKNAVKTLADKDDVAFYVLNVLSDTNKEDTSSVLSEYSISYGDTGFVLLVIDSTKSDKEIKDKLTTLADVKDKLEEIVK